MSGRNSRLLSLVDSLSGLRPVGKCGDKPVPDCRPVRVVLQARTIVSVVFFITFSYSFFLSEEASRRELLFIKVTPMATLTGSKMTLSPVSIFTSSTVTHYLAGVGYLPVTLCFSVRLFLVFVFFSFDPSLHSSRADAFLSFLFQPRILRVPLPRWPHS